MIADVPARVLADRPSLRRTLRLALALLTLAPIAGGFAFVAAYSVNAPFVDMWNYIGDLVREERTGGYDWTEIFKQHNEHRLVFPRLVLFALSGPFRLNDVAYMFVTEVGFLLAAAAVIVGASRARSEPRRGAAARAAGRLSRVQLPAAGDHAPRVQHGLLVRRSIRCARAHPSLRCPTSPGLADRPSSLEPRWGRR